jgi:nucleotide-binding universal stress UspA family protein
VAVANGVSRCDRVGAVLAVLRASQPRSPVLGFAQLFASMYGSRVRAEQVAEPHDGNTTGELARVAEHPDVQVVVVGSRNPLARALAVRLRKPLLVVPTHATVPTSLERVLFPLEGTKSTTASIRSLLERLPFDPGAELIALHSYTENDAPPYADHEPHDTEERVRNFREHYVPPGLAGPVEFRYGPPEVVVPEVADALAATLIVVSWSQVFAPGRAPLVRALLANPKRPTLLVPSHDAELSLRTGSVGGTSRQTSADDDPIAR